MTAKNDTFQNRTKTEEACETLFGRDFIVNKATLEYLQPEGIKAAYRQQLKACHPDTAGTESDHYTIERIQSAAQWLLANKDVNVILKNPNVDLAESDDYFYKGMIPKKKLKLAEYLFYSGKISYKKMIKALAWHVYRQPKLGEVMVRLGMLKKDDLYRVILKNSKFGYFGLCAFNMGLITRLQLERSLVEQRRLKQRIGYYFVNENIISSCELMQILSKQYVHNLQF